MATVMKAKYSGSWREITAPEVKYSGSWRDIISIEVKEAGSWRTVFLYAPIVSPSTNNVIKSIFTAGTCYARVRFYSDGSEANTNLGSQSGTSVSRGNWLDIGDSADVWIQRTIQSGSLSTDPGSGRLQMNVNRLFGVTRSASGTKTCWVTFNFYDAASGGSLIGTTGSIQLQAWVDDL